MVNIKLSISEMENNDNNLLSTVVPVKLVEQNKKVTINTDINTVKLFNNSDPPIKIKNRLLDSLIKPIKNNNIMVHPKNKYDKKSPAKSSTKPINNNKYKNTNAHINTNTMLFTYK